MKRNMIIMVTAISLLSMIFCVSIAVAGPNKVDAKGAIDNMELGYVNLPGEFVFGNGLVTVGPVTVTGKWHVKVYLSGEIEAKFDINVYLPYYDIGKVKIRVVGAATEGGVTYSGGELTIVNQEFTVTIDGPKKGHGDTISGVVIIGNIIVDTNSGEMNIDLSPFGPITSGGLITLEAKDVKIKY